MRAHRTLPSDERAAGAHHPGPPPPRLAEQDTAKRTFQRFAHRWSAARCAEKRLDAAIHNQPRRRLVIINYHSLEGMRITSETFIEFANRCTYPRICRCAGRQLCIVTRAGSADCRNRAQRSRTQRAKQASRQRNDKQKRPADASRAIYRTRPLRPVRGRTWAALPT